MKSKLILVLLVCAGMQACRNSGTETAGKKTDTPVAADSSNPASRARELGDPAQCAKADSLQFCSKGLPFASLKDPLADMDLQASKANVKDTVFKEKNNAGEWKWAVKKLSYPDGNVFLEEDFNGNHSLNRIRIETARFKSLHTIGVGSTAAELEKTYAGISYSSYPGMDLIEATIESAPSVLFHVDDPGGKIRMEMEKQGEAFTMPAEARIIRVVIWDVQGAGTL